MTNAETGGERRTPLTASMGARRAAVSAGFGGRTAPSSSTSHRAAETPKPAPGPRSSAPMRQSGNLPTVEEVSAGGVVIRPAPRGFEAAIIARYNRGGRLEWCLPKGHPEGSETYAEAAVREVAEETGIDGAVLTSLGSIEYWFTVLTHRVHKTVHHFLMEATGGELTIENDPDHEAVDVDWVNLEDLDRVLSFPNERRIVSAAKQVIQDTI